MPHIVNLSSIFKLNDGISPFIKLCDDYSTSTFLCRGTLFHASNYLWVYKESIRNKSLIENYKLGKISDKTFLEGLLNVFSFLKNNEKIKGDPMELLAVAWNEIIAWDADSTAHLQQLVAMAKSGDPIYFISNTNPLNVDKILSLFKEKCPELTWNIDSVRAASLNTPIEIAPNIYLCLSHKYGVYKEGTPGLLDKVSKQVGEKDMTVVSQYPKDLDIAKTMGLRTQRADEFYRESLAAKPSYR